MNIINCVHKLGHVTKHKEKEQTQKYLLYCKPVIFAALNFCSSVR